MASRRLASAITLSAGTKMNSAFGSTNFLMSHGQATRSPLTRSRVIQRMESSLRVAFATVRPRSAAARCLQLIEALHAPAALARTSGRGAVLGRMPWEAGRLRFEPDIAALRARVAGVNRQYLPCAA